MRALVCLVGLLVTFSNASPVKLTKDASKAWICGDQYLLQATTLALQTSTDIDWITANLTATVKGYRSSLWAVQTSTFDRVSTDYLPNNNSGDDLCFVAHDSILAIIVRVSPY